MMHSHLPLQVAFALQKDRYTSPRRKPGVYRLAHVEIHPFFHQIIHQTPHLIASLCAILSVIVLGCTATPRQVRPGNLAAITPPTTTPITVGNDTQSTPQANLQPKGRGENGRSDEERLSTLWRKRTQEHTVIDYPIGPGDLLEVNVGAVEELANRAVRVSGDGTIALPFVGEVQAAGLTEKQLRQGLRARLEKYMHSPQINLLVREYRSRQVAVVGAVERPGLYNLASSSDTILDVLSQAGGMKADAAPRINLIPAEPPPTPTPENPLSTLPAQIASATVPAALKSGNPIVIDLQNLTKGGNQKYLTLPARPGDVLMVSASGEVLVAGWVAKPASYKITPGLTVLGAIEAAGGPHFAANTSTVKVIRSEKDGERQILLTDLDKVRSGESNDLPVQEGDVIEVSSSTSKIVPYSFYHFLTTLFRATITY